MEFSFDKIADALYIQFSREKVIETEEISEGIIMDYGENNFIIGIEILNYTKRNINLNEIIKLNSEEIVPMIVQCQ
ncbi:MAG: DUF2283 domain-containing protein [Promethearchaeota archaeon]